MDLAWHRYNKFKKKRIQFTDFQIFDIVIEGLITAVDLSMFLVHMIFSSLEIGSLSGLSFPGVFDPGPEQNPSWGITLATASNHILIGMVSQLA